MVEEAIRTSVAFANKPMKAASAAPALMSSSQQASSLKAAHVRKRQAAKLVAQARDLLNHRAGRCTFPLASGQGTGPASVTDRGEVQSCTSRVKCKTPDAGGEDAGSGECGNGTEALAGKESRGFTVHDLGKPALPWSASEMVLKTKRRCATWVP